MNNSYYNSDSPYSQRTITLSARAVRVLEHVRRGRRSSTLSTCVIDMFERVQTARESLLSSGWTQTEIGYVLTLMRRDLSGAWQPFSRLSVTDRLSNLLERDVKMDKAERSHLYKDPPPRVRINALLRHLREGQAQALFALYHAEDLGLDFG